MTERLKSERDTRSLVEEQKPRKCTPTKIENALKRIKQTKNHEEHRRNENIPTFES